MPGTTLWAMTKPVVVVVDEVPAWTAEMHQCFDAIHRVFKSEPEELAVVNAEWGVQGIASYLSTRPGMAGLFEDWCADTAL